MSGLLDALDLVGTLDGAKISLRIALILLLSWIAFRAARRQVARWVERSPQFSIVRPIATFLIFGVCLAMVLRELGLDLSVLLGAAGVLTVAIGFASQTSASNLISGLFLMVEQPFVVGDVITIGDVTGEVLSVDLLSTRIRKFDNLLVRIPNETVLKSNVTNITHFPIRRIDLQIGVAYKENMATVRKLLFDVADENPKCLEEPVPLFIFTGYGDSALQFQFSFWTARANFLDLRNDMYEAIKTSFDEAGVEIPFPQRTVHLAAQASLPATDASQSSARHRSSSDA